MNDLDTLLELQSLLAVVRDQNQALLELSEQLRALNARVKLIEEAIKDEL